MAKVIKCQDEFLVRGASDDELVGTVSRDQFLAMAEEV
jgi:hypothetical protein